MSPARGKMRERLQTVWFMFAITVAFISAVSGAHLLTAETVARNQSLYLKRAVLKAAGLEAPAEDRDAESLYRERVRPLMEAARDDWLAVTDGTNDTAAIYVLPGKGPGLWGEIAAMIGYRISDQTLTGIAITAQNETPGLGARIGEAWYVEQFRGKQGALSLVPEGTKSKDPDKIDAITGASITSKAVRDIVNRATEQVNQGAGP